MKKSDTLQGGETGAILEDETIQDPALEISEETTDDSPSEEPPSEGDPETEVAPEAKPRPALFGTKPEEIAASIEGFADLPLHEMLREAVDKIGWSQPTPVQKLCLPYTLRGRDVAGFAQTGTGKTAVFLLTIVNKLIASGPSADGVSQSVPRAAVLCPTRELAMQIEQDAEVMLNHAGLVSLAVFGGIDYDKQARKLKEGVDIIFATPGRLKDYVQKKLIDLSQISVFVCDEADRMFDMGFIEDVEFFLERIPEGAQRLLFSATTNDQVKELAFEYLEAPEYISVTPEVITPERIEQHAYHCHATEKLRVMLGLLRDHQPECSIVFTNTKLTAEWLHYKLEHNGIEADLITGDLPQAKRIRLIQRIKEGKLKALIATDVASRGLHISRVTHVYNFDLPDDPANYVHRIGRTARAGARGFAYSLVCDDYGQNLAGINALLGGLDHQLVSEWPDAEYLAIQDQAGNPFADRYKAREASRGRSEGRGHRDGETRGRGPRETPYRDRSARSGEGAAGEWNKRPRSQEERAGGAPGKQRRGGGPGSRDQRADFKGKSRPSHHGDPRSQHSRHPTGRGARDSGTATPVPTSTPKTLGSIIKRLLKALFGWGKK